jgi:chromosome partitioning protein
MILVCGAEKGGVGKTAKATNLAVLAIEAGIDTELIDTDIQGSSRALCRIRNANNILPYIPLKTGLNDYKADLLHEATKYPLVIVDIGAQDYDALVEAGIQADFILIPTGPDQMEVESTVKVVRNLQKLDQEHRNKKMPVWVVMSRTPAVKNSREEAALRKTLEGYGVPVLNTVLADRTVWRSSRREGKAVHEMRNRAGKCVDPRAAAETKALFDEVMAKLAEEQDRQAAAARQKTGT